MQENLWLTLVFTKPFIYAPDIYIKALLPFYWSGVKGLKGFNRGSKPHNWRLRWGTFDCFPKLGG
jgi:hypothetical protein